MKVLPARPTGQAKPAKRIPQSGQVDGLNVAKLQGAIQWHGVVRLHQLAEDSESYLAEAEWPKKSGRMHYACVSTGLLFDKQSGKCFQSSQVTLKLDTVQPKKCSSREFSKWRQDRIVNGPRDITIGKRGPKPKGYVAPEPEDDE